ncbi:MAG: hypothetical protein ABI865_14610 [Nitrosospira sp.]
MLISPAKQSGRRKRLARSVATGARLKYGGRPTLEVAIKSWADHSGVLCRADRLIVEHAAHIMALLREDRWTGNGALLSRFEAVLGKRGMSPADRSTVSILKTDGAENPYGEFE